jgi:hypothetical protein
MSSIVDRVFVFVSTIIDINLHVKKWPADPDRKLNPAIGVVKRVLGDCEVKWHIRCLLARREQQDISSVFVPKYFF